MEKPIQEIFVNQANGSQFVKIHFEVIMAHPITAEQWYEVNHRVEDLIESVVNRGRSTSNPIRVNGI